MKDKDKIRLADMVIEYLNQFKGQTEHPAIHVGNLNGNLNCKIGQNGFKPAESGTPVFDIRDRYMVMLESLDGKRNVEMTYYKDDLKSCIDFM